MNAGEIPLVAETTEVNFLSSNLKCEELFFPTRETLIWDFLKLEIKILFDKTKEFRLKPAKIFSNTI